MATASTVHPVSKKTTRFADARLIGSGILREAEKNLRQALSAAARAGDYDGVANLSDLAKTVRSLGQAWGASPAAPSNPITYRRRKDRLVMTGSTGYQHKIPKSSIDRIITLMLEGFNTLESIQEHTGDNDGVKFYHVATVVRWLRSLKLIERKRGDLYNIRNSETFIDDVNARWSQLQEI